MSSVLIRFRLFVIAILMAVSACGQDDVDNLDRSIAQPNIFAFKAEPSPLAPGVPTTVTWTWRYYSAIFPEPTCEIDNGIGTVQIGTRTTITVTSSTEYRLRCVNRAGVGEATYTVITTGNQPPDGKILLPPSATINAGETLLFQSLCTDDRTPLAGLTHSWNFGGAAPNTTVAQPGPVRFPSPGRFTVTYTCTDADAAADPTPGTVTVAVLGYETPTSEMLGGSPVAVKATDINGDTLTDIVFIRSTDNTATVRLRDAVNPSLYLADVTYSTGLNPAALEIADVNGDTRPDLIIADYDDDTVSVLLQSATVPGTFLAAVPYATGSGPSAVAVADLNGDGRPDIAVTNRLDSTFSVLNQDAVTAGIFLEAEHYTTGNTPTSIAAGLLNSDNRVDLVVASSGSGRVSIHFQFGEPNDPGYFRPKLDYNAGSTPTSLALADFNGDGRLDIAVTNPGSNEISLLLQNAAPLTQGTFALRKAFSVGTNPAFATTVDMNGDTWPDLLVANRGSDSVTLLLADRGNPGSFLTGINIPTGDGPVGLAAGNLTTDTLPDLVTADLDGNGLTIIPHSLARPGVTVLNANPLVTNLTSTLSFYVIVQPSTTVTWTVDLTNDAGAALGTPSTGTCPTVIQCTGTLTTSGPVTIVLTAGTDTVATATVTVTDTVTTDDDSVNITVDLTPPVTPVITTNGGADFSVISPAVLIQGTTAADTAKIQVQTGATAVFTDLPGYIPGSTTWTFNGTIEFGTTVTYCFQALDAVGNIGTSACVNVTR